MKLHKLHVEGLRRLKGVDVLFGDATFCIGQNNSGKSSVLHAIEHLLSAAKRISDIEYYSERDSETGETKAIANKIVLEAEFRNVPADAEAWRGFKGRTFTYVPPNGVQETGVCIFYRKTYELGKDVVVELKSRKRSIKEQFSKCSTPQEFIDSGADAELFASLFSDLSKKIAAKDKLSLEAVNDIWDIGQEEEWFQNPGGIPGNVLSRLPRFLRIPAEASAYEIDNSKTGVLGKTLNELFEDVRDASDNYKQAQKLLDSLAKELDPSDASSEFGKMMAELNKVLSSVFPESQVHAKADLSDPNKALVPTFMIEMSSNIRTPVNHQGTGMIRAAVFGMLRFRQQWQAKREQQLDRSLVIGFEEPEIYLHPGAANQMRDTIYDLSSHSSQIVATTHSPFLIDLSRKPRQVLNRLHFDSKEAQCLSFNVTDEFIKLSDDDKSYVKMILRIDDYVARAFFTKQVVIVEGDSEDVAIREAIRRLPEANRLRFRANVEVIKARGKASIIGLAHYFNALGVRFSVMHDRDGGVAGAEKFNEPIQKAVGDTNRVIVLEECLEDILGYTPPSNEKPLRVFELTQTWGNDWASVPEAFRNVLGKLFSGYV